MPPKLDVFLYEGRDFAPGTKLLVIDECSHEVVSRVTVVSTIQNPGSILTILVKDSPDSSELEFELSIHSCLTPFWFIVTRPSGDGGTPVKTPSKLQFTYDHPHTHKQLGLALHD